MYHLIINGHDFPAMWVSNTKNEDPAEQLSAAWKQFNDIFKPIEPKLLTYRSKAEIQSMLSNTPGGFYALHKKCYTSEAKAMMEGKHWKGKNKCVSLPDDTPI